MLRFCATFLTIILIVAAPSAVAKSATLDEALDADVKRAMKEGHIPSLTIALVAGDEVVWKAGFGRSNLWAETEARPETVYLIGSTYKAMSMTALLQLVEAGKLSLDDPVNQYLDAFKIKNENPDNPVTFRHLLTHTSGLPSGFGGHPVWGDTLPAPLEAYLAKTMRVNGAPLKNTTYSNPAYTLVAYLIEKISGVPYRNYMQRNILTPLEMKDFAFAPRPDMEERMAMPYIFSAKNGHSPAVRKKADVWPAGIVYGTIETQANWLLMNLNGGVFKGKRLVKESSLDEAMTPQFPAFKPRLGRRWTGDKDTYGLTWWLGERDGDRVFGHSGSVNGFTAFIEGNRARRLGCVLLSNGHRAHPHLIRLSKRAIEVLVEQGYGDIRSGEVATSL
jgi:CubicO group peptidase (beta-lactamase class C family)